MLGTLITLKTSLSSDEIKGLLSFKHGVIRLTCHKLRDIITGPSKPQIHFLYPSLPFFLTDHTHSGKFFIDATAHHGHLAHCCMKIVANRRLNPGPGYPSIIVIISITYQYSSAYTSGISQITYSSYLSENCLDKSYYHLVPYISLETPHTV